MLKELQIRRDNRRVKSIQEINEFFEKLKLQVPSQFKEFLLTYEGCGMSSGNSYYYDEADGLHEINQILYLKKGEIGASIEAIYEGHQFYGNIGFIPFAIDSGGWDYNISIKEESFGQVWVDKFDLGEENPMYYVSPSFEFFINNLTEERN
tara:strand:- start:120 stop:572 length:453 start_codon:yes stop_codon:yes gene_type:complete